jgi:MoaA/NifB/PqqE/SkfB family radical SAM enzyme
MSDTFCILPWMHLATTASGTLRVCCNSTPVKNLITRENGIPYKIGDPDMTDAWTSPVMKTIRQQMLNGERPEMCARCFREEDSGIKSGRQGWNNTWAFYYEQSITPPMNIKYIDIRLGNLCNLKCRMCNPWSSNQWIAEWNSLETEYQLNDIDVANLSKMNWFDNEIVWDNISKFADTIEEIYLTGGEPTLAISQYKLLDKLIELNVAHKIKLKYNTNLINIPKKMIEYWGHFKKIKINASVDAFRDLNRYIRFPTAWESVEKSLAIFKQMSKDNKCELQIHITVQAYNVLELDQLLQFLYDNDYTDIFLNILNHPECLNVRVLPKKLKEIATERLSKWSHVNKITGLITYMNDEDWNPAQWNAFLKYTKTLDSSRNQDFFKLMPMFLEFDNAQ